jgi:ubiquinone/menaquinone biosynthesis C-methylase UbiE
LAERLDLTCADAGELPYQAQSFDAVFLCFTLELFDTPEIPSFLAQCFRVLKTEGRIGVVAMAKRERESLAVKLYEWAHKRFPKEIDCRPIMVEQALADAGFHPVEAQRMSIYRLPVDVVLARKRTPSD